jgi:hypothetical protein
MPVKAASTLYEPIHSYKPLAPHIGIAETSFLSFFRSRSINTVAEVVGIKDVIGRSEAPDLGFGLLAGRNGENRSRTLHKPRFRSARVQPRRRLIEPT